MIFFYLLVSIMPLLRHSLWGAFIGDLTLNKYVGVICLFYAMFYLVAMRRNPVGFLRTPQAGWFLGFAALAMTSFLLAGSRVSLEVSPFMNYASFVLLFFVTLTLIDSQRRLRWVVLSAVGGIAFASLHLIREWQKSGMEAGYRPGWVTGDPNYFALSAIIVLPLGYVMLIRRRAPRWERGFCGVSLVVTLLAFTLAGSRGGLIALFVVFGLIGWYSKRRTLILGVGAAMFAAFILVSPTSPLVRLIWPDHTDEQSTDVRLALLKAGLRMVAANPVTGIGLGNYKDMVHKYADPGQEVDKVAHDTYIEVAAELGLPGIAAFVTMFYFSIGTAVRVKRRAALTDQHFLHMVALGLQVGLIGAMVAIIFLSAQHVRLLWFAVILSMCLPPLAARRRQPRGAGTLSAPPVSVVHTERGDKR